MWNASSQLGPHKTGVADTHHFSFKKACLHFPIHKKSTSFTRKENNGNAIFDFFSINIFIFYIFFEASLIPVLILIMGWGYQPERIQAGIYIFFYTIIASLPIILFIFIFYINFKTLDINFINFDFSGIHCNFIKFCCNMGQVQGESGTSRYFLLLKHFHMVWFGLVLLTSH